MMTSAMTGLRTTPIKGETGDDNEKGERRQQDIIEARHPGAETDGAERDHQDRGCAADGGDDRTDHANFQQAWIVHGLSITSGTALGIKTW